MPICQCPLSCHAGSPGWVNHWYLASLDITRMLPLSRPQRWSIFQGDGMVNVFFLGHHCRQWFFNGFDKVGPSPLNVFWGVQPLESMVFRWFSKFWGQWSTMVLRLTMVWMTQIFTLYIISQCENQTTQERKCVPTNIFNAMVTNWVNLTKNHFF